MVTPFMFYVHLAFRLIYHSSDSVGIAFFIFAAILFSCSKNLYVWLSPTEVAYLHLVFIDFHDSPSVFILHLPFQYSPLLDLRCTLPYSQS